MCSFICLKFVLLVLSDLSFEMTSTGRQKLFILVRVEGKSAPEIIYYNF